MYFGQADGSTELKYLRIPGNSGAADAMKVSFGHSIVGGVDMDGNGTPGKRTSKNAAVLFGSHYNVVTQPLYRRFRGRKLPSPRGRTVPNTSETWVRNLA